MTGQKYKNVCAGVFVSLFAMALAPAARADDTAPPARNANIWNGMAHQPDRSGVASGEEKAGIALTQNQKAREDAELQNIQRNLLQQSQTPTK